MREVYDTILQNSFRQNFPAWDEMSAWDPVKMFSEALRASLGDLEKRQNRLVTEMLDCLPTLVGFEGQSGQLPAGLFALEPSDKLADTHRFPAGQEIRFHGEKGCVRARFAREFEMIPYTRFEANAEQGSLRVRFQSKIALRRLRVFFVPATDAAPVRFALGAGMPVRDSTRAFSRAGMVEWQLAEPARSGEVECVFEGLVRGSLHAQLVELEVFERAAEIPLGELQGDPWERLQLPDSLPEAPAHVVLRYPDGETRDLLLEKEDLLSLRHTDPQRFGQAVFYNAVHHALVLPGALELKKNYRGGVRVFAYDAVVQPASAWIGPESAFVRDQPKILASATPVRATRGPVPRESVASYLARFYSAMRALPARAPVSFRPEELALELPRVEPCVRAARCEHNAELKHTVFSIEIEGSWGESESEVLKRVETHLRGRLPLDQALDVRREVARG